jgi:hypothetical protein
VQKVGVRGADGSIRNLALVRRDGSVAYVCPLDRYEDVLAGDEQSVVGFPGDDVGEPVRELQI